MAIHDFLCPACGTVRSNVYITLADFDSHVETCDCGRQMDYDLRRNGKRKTRSIKFKEFRLLHTRRLDGTHEGREIHSLADIRRFEKEHQDSQVCVEAFSYDTEQHIPDPQAEAPPERMTEEQADELIGLMRLQVSAIAILVALTCADSSDESAAKAALDGMEKIHSALNDAK